MEGRASIRLGSREAVFVFGAGASADQGVPTAASFTEAIRRLAASSGLEPEVRDDFARVVEDLDHRGTSMGPHAGDNIEDVFSLWDMEKELGDLSVAPKVERLARVIAHTVELEYQWDAWQPPASRAAEKRGCTLLLKTLWGRYSSLWMEKKAAPFACLTLNYDLALEDTWNAGMHATGDLAAACYDKFFHDSFVYLDAGRTSRIRSLIEETGNVPVLPFARYRLLGREWHDHWELYPPVLKLHGSINWGICPVCGNVRIFSPKISPTASGPKALWSLLRAVCQWHPETANRAGSPLVSKFGYQPLLIPPTLGKMGQCSTLRDVWRQAAEEIRDAKRLIFVGYSLPQTDVHIRYLLAAALHGGHQPKVLVINHSDDQDSEFSVRRRYEETLGIDLRDPHAYVNGKFAESMDSIRQFLDA